MVFLILLVLPNYIPVFFVHYFRFQTTPEKKCPERNTHANTMYKRGIVKRESTVERNTHSEAYSVEKVHLFVNNCTAS